MLWSSLTRQPLPTDDQCVATADGQTAVVTLEQARNAAIINSVGVTRGLPARAVTIALATAYQESGLRNLDYGHADSVGLFQQRPSMGWGTVRQIMDPYYSAKRFYAALVKVKGWRTGDINDVAQAVQRSAHPNAYRKHVARSRALSAALTGTAPGTFSCKDGSPGKADAKGLTAQLRTAFGRQVAITARERGLAIDADSEALAWATAALVMANAGEYGVDRVSVGAAEWVHDRRRPASWTGAGSGRIVTVRLSS